MPPLRLGIFSKIAVCILVAVSPMGTALGATTETVKYGEQSGLYVSNLASSTPQGQTRNTEVGSFQAYFEYEATQLDDNDSAICLALKSIYGFCGWGTSVFKVEWRPQDKQSFYGALSAQDVALLVHGYSTSRDEAAALYRTIRQTTELTSTMVLFTWPSAGEARSYVNDLQQVELSSGDFADLVDALLDSEIKSLSIIAHSMGARFAIRLDGRMLKHACWERPCLAGVFLFNPAVMKAEMKDFLTHKLSWQCPRIYVHRNDSIIDLGGALAPDEMVSKFAGGSAFLLDGAEIVDITFVDPTLGPADAHSVWSRSKIVLDDLEDGMRSARHNATDRGQSSCPPVARRLGVAR